MLGTLLEYTSWLHRTTPTKNLVPVHSRNIATRLKKFPNLGGREGRARSVNTTIHIFYRALYFLDSCILISFPLPPMTFPAFLPSMFPWFLYHFLWFLSCIFPCFCSHFLICFPASHVFDPVIFSTLLSCFFSCCCSHFLCLPRHVLHFLNIFSRCTPFSLHFPILLLSFPSPTILLLSFPLPTIAFTTFSHLSIASSATKMADLGGIEPHCQPIA